MVPHEEDAPSPSKPVALPPVRALALCRDGCYSFSKHRSGICWSSRSAGWIERKSRNILPFAITLPSADYCKPIRRIYHQLRDLIQA